MALNYVPLIDVSPNGEIKVQGSSAYSIYLNGRPYEMAQISPKVFLETLPASAISKVEVITNPIHKFGPSADRYIINIVLRNPLVEGYMVNLNAGGNTQPNALHLAITLHITRTSVAWYSCGMFPETETRRPDRAPMVV